MAQPPPRKKSRLSAAPDTRSISSLTDQFTSSEKVLEASSELALSKLCSRCQQIDFKAIFYPQPAYESTEDRFIAELKEVVVDAECVVCCLFNAVVVGETQDSIQEYDLYAFDAPSRLKIASQSRNVQPPIALSIIAGQSRKVEFLRRSLSRDQGFILVEQRTDLKEETVPIVQGSMVQPMQINFQYLKDWLLQCETDHRDSCGLNPSQRVSIPLTCIDCHDRSIGRVSENEDYLALSYVWGSSQPSIHQTMEDGKAFLPIGGVSQVIEDAIIVVKSLGKRYLWVDQYCVDQQNQAIKAVQIREMDRIYVGAYMTITACAGSDADYGLPGISRKRDVQLRAVLPDFNLIASLPPISSAIRDATWMTRGWTYQEAVLSRRCLFFTKKQIYFVCPNMSCCESLRVRRGAKQSYHNDPWQIHTTLNPRIFQGEMYAQYTRSLSKVGLTPDVARYGELLGHFLQYMTRRLTHQGDILDAFRGLLNRSPFYSYYGVTIPSSSEQITLEDFDHEFARGIFWTTIPDYKRKRNKTYPSWSWAGWSWDITEPLSQDYLYKQHLLAQFNSVLEGFAFSIEEEDGKIVKLYDMASSVSETRIIPEKSHILIVKCRIMRLRFKMIGAEGICTRSSHDEELEDSPLEHGNATYYVPDNSEGTCTNMINETRDCMMPWYNRIQSKLLVLDWTGDVAQIIGQVIWKGKVDPRIPVRTIRLA